MKLPVSCPSCESQLKVSELRCEHCGTSIQGGFQLPVLLLLSKEEQAFILEFFLCSGSIKEMASQHGVSYPTMRNKLDEIIDKIKTLEL